METKAHTRDKRISFEPEGHTYLIDNSSENVESVTSFLKRFFPEFDPAKVSAKVFKKQYNDPESKYYKMDPTEIMEFWDKNGKEERDKGTDLHALIEDYENGKELNPQKSEERRDELSKFYTFKRDHPHLYPYRAEWMIYHEDYRLCGTIDMVYKDTHGNFHIVDWKRCKELKEKNFYEKAYEPISHMDSCNANDYILQQNMYARFLEEKYDTPISSISLCILHPNRDSYELYHIPRKDEEIDALLQYRM